jgi:hypothetical protein
MDVHSTIGLDQQAIAVPLAPGVMPGQEAFNILLVVGAVALRPPLSPGQFIEQLVALSHD